ncbi:tetratricopeptide repeat domain-containing protein [Ditylenchus destructor]|uniref:Tetratricopeptide repeat domain-containing protein n=1 Tax=Ditylenchus destructor TaxID=166010 RepID=A0AAD4MT87_9BILA|nr:tetratricopeptide repeat domain-containing protein [Ditylenchus destructor]
MSAEPSTEQIERANQLKEEANELVKADNLQEALRKYNEALHLNQDPIYYCNRAAVYLRLEEYDHAIQDCRSALRLKPNYAKAYSRMGLALSCQNLHKQAVKIYKKALDLAPNNEVYKQHLEIAEAKLREAEEGPAENPAQDPLRNVPFDMASLMNNPELMQTAARMMSDPGVQDMVSQMMTNLVQNANGQGIDPEAFGSFVHAGEALAERLNQSNPEVLEQFRNMDLNGGAREATADAPDAQDIGEFLRASEEMAQRLQQSNPHLMEQLRQQFEEGASAFTNADGTINPENIEEIIRAGGSLAERLRESNPELMERMRRAFGEGAGAAADNDETSAGNAVNDERKEGGRKDGNRKDRNAPGGK